MCGIAGIFSATTNPSQLNTQRSLVVRMNDRIAHRGPDQDGVWADPSGRCTLGHRRLSIIDISDAGRQPMGWNDGEWMIAFNGEIYNFQELRQALEAEGVRFKGRTDTEVLLGALATWGIDCLAQLDGMFAFAAFHRPTGRLFLARDPFGEKPLYYMSLPSGGLAFASELQCLEVVPEFNGEISADAISELLMFQYIGAPRTIYQQIHKLQPGHWLEVCDGEPLQPQQFFRFRPGADGYSARSPSDLADELEDILVRNLRRRLIADVPLGAFLSGGVDSSTVCALITQKLGVPLKTFSIGFAADRESEHEIARQIAAHLGTEHRDKIVSPSAIDFLNHAGQLLDEPNADSSCLPTYLLSEFARKQVTVALSGDGGDELFGGYGRYFESLREAETFAVRSGHPWSPGSNYYYSNRIMVFSPAQLGRFLGYIPSGAAEHIKRLIMAIDDSTLPLLDRLRASDAENYMPGAVLPKVDRMSMQHSLEVRTPFLNMELARFAERLPGEYLIRNGRGKLLLKEIAYRYLPREIIDLPKKGFGLPLTADWGKADLICALRESLGPDSPLGNWIGEKRARDFVNTQASDNGFSIYQVWTVVMLDKWLRARPARLPDPEALSVIPERDVPRYYSVGGTRPVRMVGFVAPSVLIVTSPTDVSLVQEDACIQNQLPLADCGKLPYLADVTKIDISASYQPCKEGQTLCFDASQNMVEGFRNLSLNLAGCTLVSLDPDPGWIGLSDIQCLRGQRLRKLVVPEPHSEADWGRKWIQYEFNYFGVAKRVVSLARLLPHVQAAWRPARRGSEQGGGAVAGPFEKLPAAHDRELGLDYALFEGPSQFLPLVSSHDEILRSAERRYSVWNRAVLYSSPENRHPWYLRPVFRFNWLVPICEVTAPLLPVVSRSIQLTSDPSAFKNALKHLVENTNEIQTPVSEPHFFILYTHGLSAGGAERQWCNLAIGLKAIGKRVCVVVENLEAEKGHYLHLLTQASVDVLSLSEKAEEGLLVALPEKEKSPLYEPSISPPATNVALLTKVLSRLKPDVVVSQLDFPNITAAVAALLTDIPRVVMSFRNYNPSNFPYLNQPYYVTAYQALSRSKRIILTGNSVLGNNDYAQWIGVEPARVKMLQNAFEPDSMHSMTKNEKQDFKIALGLESEAKVVLGVFRLSAEKNPLLFVDVCTDVLEKDPDVIVLLCGEGPMRAEIESRVRSRGLAERFRLLGRRSEIWKYISIADVLLMTSDKEGTPNIIREALMLHCPVVSTASGAVPEMIQDGVTGYILPLGDRVGLVAKLQHLLSDNTGHSRMVEAIRQHPYRFSARDKALQLLEILNTSSGMKHA